MWKNVKTVQYLKKKSLKIIEIWVKNSSKIVKKSRRRSENWSKTWKKNQNSIKFDQRKIMSKKWVKIDQITLKKH